MSEFWASVCVWVLSFSVFVLSSELQLVFQFWVSVCAWVLSFSVFVLSSELQFVFEFWASVCIWVLSFSVCLSSELQFVFEFWASVSVWVLCFSLCLSSELQFVFEFCASVCVWVLSFSLCLSSVLQFVFEFWASVCVWVLSFSLCLSSELQFESAVKFLAIKTATLDLVSALEYSPSRQTMGLDYTDLLFELRQLSDVLEWCSFEQCPFYSNRDSVLEHSYYLSPQLLIIFIMGVFFFFVNFSKYIWEWSSI